MNVQLRVNPPSGVSVTGSMFAEYGGDYMLNPGDERSFSVRIQATEEGVFEAKAETRYTIEGVDKTYMQDETLKLTVAPPSTPTPAPAPPASIVTPSPTSTQGFEAVIAILGLLAVAYLMRRRK